MIPITWVYDAWDQLVLEKGARLSFDERKAGWRELHDRCFVDGTWTISIHDATLVASLGYFLSLEARSYAEARERMRELLSHAEIHQLGGREVRDHVLSEAIADYLCGNTDAAVSRMRDCLKESDPRELVGIRIQPAILLEALRPDDVPTEGLISFVADVVGAHEGLAEAAARARAATTVEELRAALAMFYRRQSGTP